MEIEGEDGSKTLLRRGLSRELGRDLGFKTNDRTVSRRQVSFQLHSSPQIDDPKVCFEVTGKNPIWVKNSANGQIKVYRRYEKGEMDIGDRFCISAKNPIWFALKKIDSGERDSTGVKTMTRLDKELAECLNSSSSSSLAETEELEPEDVDISNIDPVKEFGFLVIGKEFEGYNRKVIRDIKSLDWLLTEPSLESEDDDDDDDNGKGKRISGKKRKKPKGNKEEDDEWVGESDEDKVMITKSTKTRKPKYSTRSMASDKTLDAKLSKKPRMVKATVNIKKGVEDDEDADDADDDDDADDETLGGFIVDDEGAEQEVESDVADDEEEEFEDDADDE